YTFEVAQSFTESQRSVALGAGWCVGMALIEAMRPAGRSLAQGEATVRPRCSREPGAMAA
ncbi:MAG: hypothetical protein AB8G99_24985, partial [Planctomycetaceae bacterium]